VLLSDAAPVDVPTVVGSTAVVEVTSTLVDDVDIESESAVVEAELSADVDPSGIPPTHCPATPPDWAK
jgi:hypothetical protein